MQAGPAVVQRNTHDEVHRQQAALPRELGRPPRKVQRKQVMQAAPRREGGEKAGLRRQLLAQDSGGVHLVFRVFSSFEGPQPRQEIGRFLSLDPRGSGFRERSTFLSRACAGCGLSSSSCLASLHAA